MEQNRVSRGRLTLFDVALGVLIAMPIPGIAVDLRTLAAVRSVESLGRVAILVAALFFAVFYWLESTQVFRVLDRRAAPSTGSSQEQSIHSPSSLLLSVNLVMLGLLGVAIALASVETLGWFLGVNAVIWALDLIFLLLMRRRSTDAARSGVPEDGAGPGPKALASLIASSGIQLLVFGALTAWNVTAPWGQRGRALAGIAFLAWVVVGHVAWRFRRAAEATL